MIEKRTFAFVFARGGSKGLPNKNILPLNGIPLITRAIEIAKSISEIERIFVSTDSQAIAELADRAGAEVIVRPPELASDDSPEWKSWQHAIVSVTRTHGNFDVFISIPAVAPLRKPEDVRKAMVALSEDADIVLTLTSSRSHPMFSMVRLNEKGFVELHTPASGSIKRRQDAPPAFDITPVAYVSRPSHILKTTSIWDGRVVGVQIPNERAIDIDTELDYRFAEFLILSSNDHD